MHFTLDNWDKLLPDYLLSTDKDRLKKALSQFFSENQNKERIYEGFYLKSNYSYFLQGDIIKKITSLDWDFKKDNYVFYDRPVMLLSNTCDVSDENNHLKEKQALYAPILKLSQYISSLEELGATAAQIESTIANIKNQMVSNILYLPPNPINANDYICFLDNIFWQPSKVLKAKIPTIENDRFISLNQFGFYLLIIKMSFHFCRVPEEIDR